MLRYELNGGWASPLLYPTIRRRRSEETNHFCILSIAFPWRLGRLWTSLVRQSGELA